MVIWVWRWWLNVFLQWSHVFCVSFYFPHFHFSYFIFTLLIKEILRTFLLRSIHYKESKEHVGAGIGTLMSISDGPAPSIFCRKMEKARPAMEEMDGKVVYFPARVGILTLKCWFLKNFFADLCFDLAGKQLCFPSGKSINRRNEKTGVSPF